MCLAGRRKQKCPAASHVYLYRFYQLQSIHRYNNVYVRGPRT